ncbi:uncharacterized protein xirp2a [Aplochiton taeniatus]
METQSGDGGREVSMAASPGSVSSGPPEPRSELSGSAADEAVLREDLQGAKQIERFHVPLDRLKRMFEKPSDATAYCREPVSAPPAFSQTSHKLTVDAGKWGALRNQYVVTAPPFAEQPGERSECSAQTNKTSSAGSASGSGSGPAEGAVSQRNGEPEAEAVSVKERRAMYQAAVSKKEASGSSSSSGVVMEESEACTLPGGLASVKKQFESQEFASSTSQSSVTQISYQHRSVQEVSSSAEVTVRSSREVIPTQQVTLVHDQQVTQDQRLLQNNVTAGYGNHYDETVTLIGGEDLPKVSARALKQQYEKTMEEAAPSKQIKIDMDFNQFQWAPVAQSSQGSATSSYEASSTVRAAATACSSTTAVSASSLASGGAGALPPPPAEMLQAPREFSDDHASHQLQEASDHQRLTINKEQYFKQKSMAELKRLCKHINPEFRKDMEADFLSQVTETGDVEEEEEEMMVAGEVQQACYAFENDGSSPSKCMSPEREYLEWDEILKGEVQSMRWMFENKPLDAIKDETPDEDEVRNIGQQEIIAGKDVRYTAWMFETQPMDELGTETPDSTAHGGKPTELARGDVRTATWLFETQPLDGMNRIYQEDEQEALGVVVTKDITGGDVKTARYLFETQHLDSLSHTETFDESHFLNLKSELEEIKGEVKTTTRMFETQPMCVIRGDSGEMLEITTIRREETEKGDVKTSRWMFETQPLDMINKDPSMVKLICGVSMEDNSQGGVNRGRWLFETKTLDTIKDEEWESSRKQREEILGADVRKHCLVFETQPMDSLKDNANARPLPSEEIVGGDVRSATHLFETVPMENLKDLAEVGKLQRRVASEEEKGDVRHQKWVFESQPLENIREEKKEFARTINIQELDKGDVTNYKEKFETLDLSKCDGTQKIQVEGVTSGSVKSNKDLFESTPTYAMQDSSGHYHEVKTVRREEIVKGDVRSCRWMFETRPIDEFDESVNKFQIIKGISKQEIESGDVKTAKWLFETQALDAIKCSEEEESTLKDGIQIERGDVKSCRWLFETQPMDVLYEKSEKSETDVEEVHKGDVKTCTWLFETQTLDNIRDHTESETILKTCTVNQEDVHGKDVRLARFLFETEKLENITGEDNSSFRRVTKIDIDSGDVSRMKFVFENRSSDIMTSTSEETMQQLKTRQAEDIQKGNVVNCTWKFENQSIDAIRDGADETTETRTVTDVQGGNVDKGRFIFETYSLDKIQEESTETEISTITNIIRDEIEKGDVKNYTMMFESQPLYAIRDKEGHYHEVTTVTKEEIMRGDVVGARWLFETKPLDAIRSTEEVYVIKAVTEEDVQKGDVTSARYRFETQPLDEIGEDLKTTTKTVENIQGGDVKANAQRFEGDEMSQKCVRTVSVSEIQKGDVRSSTWMFETRTIDKIRGDGGEYKDMERVTKEEVMKGDVKQSVWLFEEQPLDRIRDADGAEEPAAREEIPPGDVKTTTWLFESTPLNSFNESRVTRTEIVGKSIKGTLEELYSQKMVDSQGILLEADEIGDVRMCKYRLMNQEAPEIQREEVIRGDLNNIMVNLLNRRESTEKGITIDEEERGHINTTVRQLFHREQGSDVEKEEIIRGDIQEAISSLLREEGSSKRGILIQEDEKGDVRMTIYSLLNKEQSGGLDKEDIIQGNVSRTVQRLLSNPGSEESRKIRIGDTERGNVSFYSTCIESGALDYLKQLQFDSGETEAKIQKELIIGGDIEETKISLRRNQQHVGRTVAVDDIVPGDVHNTVQVFMTEPSLSLSSPQREEVVKGDLRAALDSLTRAAGQRGFVEKEEVVKGDIPTALRSLEEAQRQARETEKPEIVPGDIRGALQSLEKSAAAKAEASVEDLVPGDVKGTLKSLEEAKQAVKELEKEQVVRGDIHTAMQHLQEASTDKRVYQHQVSEQGDVRGTIQLLLEPSTSPRTQRRGSTEGDVRTSIKTLYEGQEQSQAEKEEVVKGDVRGAIKCLMQKKQYSNPKRMYQHRKGRAPAKNPLPAQQATHECSAVAERESVSADPAPAVRNLSQSADSQSRVQKHSGGKSVRSKNIIRESHTKQSASAVTHQQSFKTKKAGYRNLEPKGKGTIQKGAAEIHFPPPPSSPPPPSESELSLPPPPSPVSPTPMSPAGRPLIMRQDSDLPPPPPPPPVDCLKAELEFFPPPPPPAMVAGQQDFLPPPPTQQEMNSMPQQVAQPTPGKPGKATGRPLFKIPKPEPPVQAKPIQVKPKWQKKPAAPAPCPPPPPPPPPAQPMTVQTEHKQESEAQEVVEEMSKHVETSKHAQAVTAPVPTSKIPAALPVTKPAPEELPRPPKKVFVPPIKIPPPAEAAPKPRPYARKFKTPLMLAEERFRQEREETERNKATTPTSPASYKEKQASASGASAESLSTHTTETREGAAATTQQKIEETQTVKQDERAFRESSAKTAPSPSPSGKPLISSVNKQSASGSANISFHKKPVPNEQSAAAPSDKQLASSEAFPKSQAAPFAKRQAAPAAVAHPQRQGAAVKVQSGSAVTVSSAMEQQSVEKSSSQSAATTQSAVQENLNVQSQSTVELKAEEAKKTNSALTQETKKGLSQPTKIPKVTPNFKVKTVKISEKKDDKTVAGQQAQHAVKMELHLQKKENKSISKASESQAVKEATHVASSISENNNEEVQTKSTQQTSRKEKEAKHFSSMKVVPGPKHHKPAPPAQAPQGQGHVAVSHGQQSVTAEHTQRHEEVVVTERIVQQSFQKHEAVHQETVQTQAQQVTSSQQQRRAETSKTQLIQDKSKVGSGAVPAKCSGGAEHTDQGCAAVESTSVESTDSEKCQLVQKILFQIKELHGAPGKLDPSSVKMILNKIPDWLIGSDERNDLIDVAMVHNKKKLKEIIIHVRNITQAKLIVLESNLAAMETPPPPPEKKILSGATTKISKISIGSSKVESHRKVVEENKSLQQSMKQELSSEVKNADPGVASPLTSIRSPSPTFISIESARRTDSPLGSVSSPTPSHVSASTPPPPPPRTPTMARFSRATPSPTLSRSEKILKLKDTTSKLSRGMTPPPPMPVPVDFFAQLASERGDSPGPTEGEVQDETGEEGFADVTDMGDSMMTVRDKKSFFEEAQRAEVNKTYARRDPIEIPERLGADDPEEAVEGANVDLLKEDLPKIDLSKLVNRFESPQPKVYARKDPILITERLGSDTEEAEADPKTPKMEEIPAFDIKAIKNVFETGEHNSQAAREWREKQERRESESAEQTAHCVAEHFTSLDEFGNATSGVESEAARLPESLPSHPSPPSYADVVRGKALEAAALPDSSTEALLKSFQQSWTESQTAFQTLGFSVSEQRTSQVVSRQQETVVTENSSSRVRTVSGMSEEGVSHGISDRGQTKLP